MVSATAPVTAKLLGAAPVSARWTPLGMAGLTAGTAALRNDVPSAPIATTVTVYGLPLVSPATV
jgi:hypothetical protein